MIPEFFQPIIRQNTIPISILNAATQIAITKHRQAARYTLI